MGMLLLDFVDTTLDQCCKDVLIDVLELLDVETTFASLVFA